MTEVKKTQSSKTNSPNASFVFLESPKRRMQDGLGDSPPLDLKLLSLYVDIRREREAHWAIFDIDDDVIPPQRQTPGLNKHLIAYRKAIHDMCVTPALSGAGLAAKARIIKQHVTGTDDETHPLVLSLLNDCIRLCGFLD